MGKHPTGTKEVYNWVKLLFLPKYSKNTRGKSHDRKKHQRHTIFVGIISFW